MFPLRTLVPARLPPAPTVRGTVLQFDASPWGLGGVLVRTAAGQPPQFFADAVQPEDEVRLQLSVGSSAGQVKLETLAIVLGMRLWASLLCECGAVVRVASDSVAALSAMHKMASPVPVMNGPGAELALILEESGSVQLAFDHIPGKLNSLADWCSRVHRNATKLGIRASRHPSIHSSGPRGRRQRR